MNWNMNNSEEFFLFQKIKKDFENSNNELKVDDWIKLVKKLYLLYDPSINENKFIVGHSMELLFSFLLKSLGYKTQVKGSNEIGYDVEINGSNFSLKTSSKPKTNIRLKNVRGKKDSFYQLKYPTILIELGTGIMYFDSIDVEINNVSLIDKQSDGFDISWKDIKYINEKNKSLIKLEDLVSKQKIIEESKPVTKKSASYDVVLNLLNEYSKELKKFNK